MSRLGRLDDFARSDLIIAAAGLLIALAVFELIRSFAENMVMPIIFAIFGATEFPFLTLTIGDAELAYGLVLIPVIALAIVCALVVPLWRAHLKYDGLSETRSCPECLTSIPMAAKRCPECTAVLTPEAG